MDKVRLGRALGQGARQAAKTVMQAADAIAAPSPDKPAGAPPQHAAAEPTRPVSRVAQPEVFPPARPVPHTGSVANGARGFGNAVWRPLATYTSVLWLEVTGAFYAIFAVMLGTAAWHQRGAVYAAAAGAGAGTNPHRFWMYVALASVFTYFTVTNFLRARSRGRR